MRLYLLYRLRLHRDGHHMGEDVGHLVGSWEYTARIRNFKMETCLYLRVTLYWTTLKPCRTQEG
jgi:hypothetical protein